MASLSCLSIFEAGAFGSNSGNVIVPTTEQQFPVTITGRAVGFGASYGFARRVGAPTSFAARGAGASWGYAVRSTASTADADDLLIIII